MDGHSLSPYTCKCSIVFKQFDGLYFGGLAGKCQKCQNSPHHNFALYGIPPLSRAKVWGIKHCHYCSVSLFYYHESYMKILRHCINGVKPFKTQF